MKDYEVFLNNAINAMDKNNSVNSIKIENYEREIIKELETKGLIKNIRYISNFFVGFDLTYNGINYFD